MTPHEKALHAVNARLERLQANLREANGEAAQRFLFQALVATVAIAEALHDYIKAIGAYAQRRGAELKQANEALERRHAELLKAGQALLEQLKANPTDRALRHEIDAAQQGMAAVQKTLRRGANALQRDLGPGLARIDEMSVALRRFSEADNPEALQRVVRLVIAQTHELYRSHPSLPTKEIVDPATWEHSVLSELRQTADFHDAYARIGYQVTLALELMILALAPEPPRSAADATRDAMQAVANRIQQVTRRFAAPDSVA